MGGDAIQQLLYIGQGSDTSTLEEFRVFIMVVAIIMFCICLLNLFIAVHGEAYSEAHRQTNELLLQERAKICFNRMMMPAWNGSVPSVNCGGCRCGGWRVQRRQPRTLRWHASALLAPAFALFCGLAAIDGLTPIIPALILLTMLLITNAVMLQRPWNDNVERDRSYLWWCTPVRDTDGKPLHQRGVDLEGIMERIMYLEASVERVLIDVTSTPSCRGSVMGPSTRGRTH